MPNPLAMSMWDPNGEAKRYEASGSRTSFSAKWHPYSKHVTQQKAIQHALNRITEIFGEKKSDSLLHSHISK